MGVPVAVGFLSALIPEALGTCPREGQSQGCALGSRWACPAGLG